MISSNYRMGKIKHIHFIGIGGAGMCGIAEVLHNEGYHISGSDVADGEVVQRLRGLGITIYIGHAKENIHNADVVVKSTIIQANNPELEAATQKGIPIIPRAMMLAELMRFRYGIAVAGTHGKTTTTSLVSSLLAQGNLDPSYVIGGQLNRTGSNAKLGTSSYLVAEADESDASFLFLKPMMAIITNIDEDHMETYQHNFNALRKTFLEFLHHLPFYGLAILCIDDREVQRILPQVERPVCTYGFSKNAHYRATDWTQKGLVSHFTVHRPAPYGSLSVTSPLPGRHNVQNALAAIIVATELGLSDAVICQGLASFQGVGRRFQLLGSRSFPNGKALIITDYGHHPREIMVTLEACRQVWPERRLVHVFQPHRYSRTRDLLPEFTQVLTHSDALVLLDIYPAGEAPLPGVSSEALLSTIQQTMPHAQLSTAPGLTETLAPLITDECILLMQGAGSINQLAHNLVQEGLS